MEGPRGRRRACTTFVSGRNHALSSKGAGSCCAGRYRRKSLRQRRREHGPCDHPAGVLTASDVHVADYPTVQALRWVGDMISRESGGDLSMRVYHSGQLGRENDTVDLARFGGLDITRINFASLNNAFPATQAMSLPYVFDSTEHMRRAVDGAAGRSILEAFEKRGL